MEELQNKTESLNLRPKVSETDFDNGICKNTASHSHGRSLSSNSRTSCGFASVGWRSCLTSSSSRHRDQPPITRTCRAIRAETIKLFYAGDEFRACDGEEGSLSGLPAWGRTTIVAHGWADVKVLTISSSHTSPRGNLTYCFEHNVSSRNIESGPLPSKARTKPFKRAAQASHISARN